MKKVRKNGSKQSKKIIIINSSRIVKQKFKQFKIVKKSSRNFEKKFKKLKKKR